MKKEKAQKPGSTHGNQGGLPKVNFCLAQAVERERQEYISSPLGSIQSLSQRVQPDMILFSCLAVRLTALYSLGIKEEHHNGSSLFLLLSYII